MLVLAVALAGAIGALARWGLSVLLLNHLGPRFPFGTLSVNLIGCLLLGILMEGAEHLHWLTAEMRITIAVGFIGTLTTFSTWEFDTFRMAQRGEIFWAAGNLAVNTVFGFALIWAGLRVGALLWR